MKLSPANHFGEEVYTCSNRDGLRLSGIVHRPELANGRGLLLLPAGMKYRVGAHGFYVWIARQLARRGYTVLRADTAGIGYSDGPPQLGLVHEIWRRVEQGALVADAMELARDFRRCYRLDSLVAGGICGAAITAQLLAVASDPGLLDGVLAINAPISLSGLPQERRMNAENTSRNARRYLRKLFSGFAWDRLLRGESDFSAIYAFLRIFLRNCFARKGERNEGELCDLNEKFVSSYRDMSRNGIRVLYLFGGGDSHWTDFKSTFLKYYLHGKTEGENYSVEVIPDANHELYLQQWQNAALESIQGWLDHTVKQADISAEVQTVREERTESADRHLVA